MAGEEETAMAPEKRGKGCIKTTMGSWRVRRVKKNGEVFTSWRRPSGEERARNKLRERRRREVAARIYAGLRERGNYRLPKHPDKNDLLKALCEEAGYAVDGDGNLRRKNITEGQNSVTYLENNNEKRDGDAQKEEVSLELTLSFNL